MILWLVWKLDLLTRRRNPWTVHRKLHPRPERRPTRTGLPDYGEFGRFEWSAHGAYGWLVLASVVESALGASSLMGMRLPVSSDAVRHMYLMGFITHLILGMTPRMIPGFLHRKGVARPGLVAVSFWLATVAALTRIVSLVLPPDLLSTFPKVAIGLQRSFAFSGVFAMLAVACLAINLIQTARR